MKNGAAAEGTQYIYGVSIYLWGFNRGMPHKKFWLKITKHTGLSTISCLFAGSIDWKKQ